MVHYLSAVFLDEKKKMLIEILKEGEELEIALKRQKGELKEAEEKTKRLKADMKYSISRLKYLSAKKEELKRMIENSKTVVVIAVDDEMNSYVRNGLVDLKRDILMKLIKLVEDKAKTRNIIGMTSVFYKWSKLRIFRWSMSETCMEFRPNPCGHCVISHTPSGKHCFFDGGNMDRTIFLNKSFTIGFLRWTIKVEYSTDVYSDLEIGVIPSSLLGCCDTLFLGQIKGTCCFGCYQRLHSRVRHSLGSAVFEGAETGSYLRGVHGVSGSNWRTHSTYVSFGVDVGVAVPNGSLVTAEVDISAHTLHFFVDGVKVPCAITNIPAPLHIGVKGHRWASFTSVSFSRFLTAPTYASAYTAPSISTSTSISSSSASTSTIKYRVYKCIRNDKNDGTDVDGDKDDSVGGNKDIGEIDDDDDNDDDDEEREEEEEEEEKKKRNKCWKRRKRRKRRRRKLVVMLF